MPDRLQVEAEMVGKFLVLGGHHRERGMGGDAVDADPVPGLRLSFRQRALQHDRGGRRRQPAQCDHRYDAEQQQAGNREQQEMPQAPQVICAPRATAPLFRATFTVQVRAY